MQIVNLAIATAIYFPFVRAQDRTMLADERAEIEGAVASVSSSEKPEAAAKDAADPMTTTEREDAAPALHEV